MTITNLQILKKIGIFNIDKMRCIQLTDPGFDIKKIQLIKGMMADAEATNNIQNN